MLLELKKALSGEESRLPFEYEMDLSTVTVNTVFPFVSPVIIKGEVRQGNACAYLTAGVEYNFIMPCDRCNREIRQKSGAASSILWFLSWKVRMMRRYTSWQTRILLI